MLGTCSEKHAIRWLDHWMDMLMQAKIAMPLADRRYRDLYHKFNLSGSEKNSPEHSAVTLLSGGGGWAHSGLCQGVCYLLFRESSW